MKYTMTTPCDACPFLAKNRGYTMKKLRGYASGEFHCHKTGTTDEDDRRFVPTKDSLHCAGALIFLEKREAPHQMMRICERLGMYDPTKLNMNAEVR